VRETTSFSSKMVQLPHTVCNSMVSLQTIFGTKYLVVLFGLLVLPIYEACAESKDTKVLNMYNIFNLQKLHCEWIACT